MNAKVGIIMGSDSDLPVMRAAGDILSQLEVPFEMTIVSAHRTPDRLYEYAGNAEARGLRVIIAGAGVGGIINGNRCHGHARRHPGSPDARHRR